MLIWESKKSNWQLEKANYRKEREKISGFLIKIQLSIYREKKITLELFEFLEQLKFDPF